MILFRIRLLKNVCGFKLRYIETVRSGLIRGIVYKVSFEEEKQKIQRYNFDQKKGYHYHIELFEVADYKKGRLIKKVHVPIGNILNHKVFRDFVLEQCLEHFH